MRHPRRISGFIMVSLLATRMAAPPVAMGGVQGSVHDFTLATGANTFYKDTTGLAKPCETCHLPHTGGGSITPIWNHTLSTVTYSWSEVTTLAGTTLPTSFDVAPTGVGSKACLSCHDGSVAVGSQISGPSWDTTKKLTGALKVTGAGNSDMTGNHPVGIPYPDQNGAQYNGITSAANAKNYNPAPSLVKIYGTTAGAKGVECGTCHDPHDAAIGQFLRAADGVLCLDCHIK